ncbi:MAG: efflux RND transporter periplasmic adaptor subunit [Phycisphaerae bacterium]|nr:efflux RND transporter periplasmic adaptor subunit [Phycisphaerae bacterium]
MKELTNGCPAIRGSRRGRTTALDGVRDPSSRGARGVESSEVLQLANLSCFAAMPEARLALNEGPIIMRNTGFAAFVAVIVGGTLLLPSGCSTSRADETAAETPATKVVVAPVRRAVFERRVVVQGNVQAKNLALISPRVSGTLDDIMVDEGDRVVAGVTHLFQTDSVILQKTVEVRHHEVNVAEESLRERQASLEKSRADLEKAEFDWNRYQRLFERGTAADEEYEEAKAEYKRCTALVKLAEASVGLADAQLAQSRSALEIAEKDLRDSLVIAPIDGVVTVRYQEPGEMGGPGNPVLRIEDPTLLEVSVFLPARTYGEVIPDETRMFVEVNGVDLGEQVVSYKSPTINNTLRTFEARCLMHNPPEAVASGAMARVRVILERRDAIGVPRDAIQRRGDGAAVFVVEGNTARMVAVKPGLDMDGLVEVTSDQIAQGDAVVTVGAYFLNQGTEIEIQQESDQ